MGCMRGWGSPRGCGPDSSGSRTDPLSEGALNPREQCVPGPGSSPLPLLLLSDPGSPATYGTSVRAV